MSQADINIGFPKTSCKTAPQSAQRQAGAQRVPQRTHRTISASQRAKLSAAQLAYIATDPRWVEHRRKLAAAQEARRMTLFDSEVTAILKMRKKGRTFSYIAEEIGICRDVIMRELAAGGFGFAAERVKADRRARRGKGFWRSFD